MVGNYFEGYKYCFILLIINLFCEIGFEDFRIKYENYFVSRFFLVCVFFDKYYIFLINYVFFIVLSYFF